MSLKYGKAVFATYTGELSLISRKSRTWNLSGLWGYIKPIQNPHTNLVWILFKPATPT